MSTDTDGTHPEIPDKGWTNPFPEGHPMHDLYERRISNSQDLVIILDDYHSRRGTGKTVASLQLAEGMDQNDGLTWANVSLSPQELRNAYSQLPQRSALVLDEGEVGASNREAMSKTNRALREIMSMGRVEEKYVVVNTPSIGFIDKHIRQLADVWITMVRKGAGLVHFLKRQPYSRNGEGTILTVKKGMIEFNDIETGTRLRDVYNQLTEEKQQHIRGNKGSGFVPMDEHEEALQKAREEARHETRNEIIRDVYNHPEINELGLSQRMLGEAVGLTQQHIGRIVRQHDQ